MRVSALLVVSLLAICAVMPAAYMGNGDATNVEDTEKTVEERIEMMLNDPRLLKELDAHTDLAFAQFIIVLNTLVTLMKEYNVTSKELTDYLFEENKTSAE